MPTTRRDLTFFMVLRERRGGGGQGLAQKIERALGNGEFEGLPIHRTVLKQDSGSLVFRQSNEGGAGRFIRRAAARPGNAGDGQREVGAEKAANARRPWPAPQVR